MKRTFTTLGLAFVLSLATACGGEPFDPFAFMNPEFDEGLNLHDMTGTITIPAAQTNTIGAIYIGLFSGVDDLGGYPLPITAPGTEDAFPYGGTSIGTYEGRNNTTGLRDPTLGCSVVNNREFHPDPDTGDFQHSFLIRQFPFYAGATVWAFADQDATSCDPDGGYEDPGDDLEDPNDDEVYPSNYSDVLNFPQDYANAGDYVTDTGVQVLQDVNTHIQITLDCRIDAVDGC